MIRQTSQICSCIVIELKYPLSHHCFASYLPGMTEIIQLNKLFINFPVCLVNQRDSTDWASLSH